MVEAGEDGAEQDAEDSQAGDHANALDAEGDGDAFLLRLPSRGFSSGGRFLQSDSPLHDGDVEYVEIGADEQSHDHTHHQRNRK